MKNKTPEDVKVIFSACPMCQRAYALPNEMSGNVLCSCGMESRLEHGKLVVAPRIKTESPLSWETDEENPDLHIMKIGGLNIAELSRENDEDCWACVFRHAVAVPEVKFMVVGQTEEEAEQAAANHIRELLQTMSVVSSAMLPAFSI